MNPSSSPVCTPKMPARLTFHSVKRCGAALLCALTFVLKPAPVSALEPVPEKLVVLTFDDSVSNHATHVAPLLKKMGFGATFFITEGFNFLSDKTHYLTWEQIQELHKQGFEIGNHTRNHKGVAKLEPETLVEEVGYIEQQCEAHGIPKPKTFCYPGYGASPVAAQFLRNRGYLFARAGGGRVFEPGKDDPLLMPQAFDGKPNSTLESFKAAVENAKNGNVAVLTFHGVPDIQHPWVSTDPTKFESYMNHLKETGCKVISLGELSRYVDATKPPGTSSSQPGAPVK